ncbi:MAG: halocyanin domain-containing protein [Haloarculaceae archaeon]
MRQDRRRFLRFGGLAAVGTLAGCAFGNPGDSDTTETPADTTPTPTETPTPTPATGDIDYGDWFADTDNFDGTTVDARGESEVTVTVGAQGNGGAFAFDPPAVHVDPGATVVWEWTGEGGTHNVVELDESFTSGAATAEAGTTFEHTFESDGLYRYFCTPHRGLGMKGAVAVGDPSAGSDGDGGPQQYGWQAATFDSYWYSLYNMSTNIAMSGNGIVFPATEDQQETFQQRFPEMLAAADQPGPPIKNPNLNMAPFTEGDPSFTEKPVLEGEDGRPDASTLQWDPSASSKTVSPQSLAWTHLKGVTWAKNFQKHFDILPESLAAEFRSMVLSTLAQVGTAFALVEGNLRLNDENMLLGSAFRPGEGIVDESPRPLDHSAMLWFLSDLTSLAQGGWFGYENPEPLIPAQNVQALADGMAQTTMNAFDPESILGAGSTRDVGEMLGAVGWYGTHAGNSELESMAADYASSLGDTVVDATGGNGRVENGADNQAATQGIVAQGLLWASQIDGVDYTDTVGEVVGYMADELWDADAGTFASGDGDSTYTITARDAGDITGGLNAAEAVLGRTELREVFARFFDETFNTGGLQRAQRPPSVNGRDNEPPLPPKAGGEFGQAAVYNAEIEYDTGSGEWSVTDDTFRTGEALYLANQDIWVGSWAGDFYQGRGVPGQSDEPPN